MVASVIIAIGFNPARVRLQRLIDRALYGDRRDPVRAVSLVGERLAGTGTAGLASVLEALCDSLRLPFAAVRFGPAEAASYGTPPELLHRIRPAATTAPASANWSSGSGPGSAGSARPTSRCWNCWPGHWRSRCTPPRCRPRCRSRGCPSWPRARRSGRRLRRDLHDGLGPALTGIAFKADAARNTLRAEPAQASELLGALRADTTAAIADIRRLVYDLRPPALDDLGLIGSVRQQSARLAQRPDGGSVPVAISAPETLPPLPAAVEVAAYRIITEAMTNAARHSGATRIEVRLTLAGDGLCIEVCDDGGADGASYRRGLAARLRADLDA